jgi:hypothetical protein
MILVMGVTGTGKSYFINKLREGAASVGHDISSRTSCVQIFESRSLIPANRYCRRQHDPDDFEWKSHCDRRHSGV